jgi:hypothetical protein
MQLVPVKAAALSSRNGGTVPPRSVLVGEPLPLSSTLRDEPLSVRICGYVGGVDSHVAPHFGVGGPQGRGASVQASVQSGTVRAELFTEAIASPKAWTAAENGLQAGVLSDQRRYTSPGRERKQALDEASADESAGTIAPAARPAQSVKLGDESDYFGRIEESANVANSRATRYLARCHRSSSLRWSRPRQCQLRGGIYFAITPRILQGASDGVIRWY